HPPPAVQPGVVAATLAGNPEKVRVGGLAELAVRPNDDGVSTLEVAEPRAAVRRGRPGRGWIVQPLALSAPAHSVALALVGRDVMPQALRLVRAPDGRAAREGRDREAIGSEALGIRRRQADGRLERAGLRRALLIAGFPDRGGDEIRGLGERMAL